VLRVDIRLNDAIENLKILEDNEAPLRSMLNALMNRELTEDIALPDTLIVESIPENYRRDSLLANSPRLNALELRAQGAMASQEAARKQGLPGFGLGLDYIIVDERSQADIPQNGQDALMPTLKMRIPIFRGKYNAAKKEAELMQEAYKLKKQDRANELKAGYDMASFELQKQLNLLQLYRRQAQTSQQALNILLSAYANNEKDFEEVLRMQQQLLKYQKMEITALVAFKIEKAKIDYITSKSR
jgi:outer membrane protein TolC